MATDDLLLDLAREVSGMGSSVELFARESRLLADRVGTLAVREATLKERVGRLRSDVDEATKEIGRLEGRTIEVEGRIKGLRSDVDRWEKKDDARVSWWTLFWITSGSAVIGGVAGALAGAL